MKNFFKSLGILFITICVIMFVIAICLALGYLFRFFVWLICIIWEFLYGPNFIIEWISNHDHAVHIICSFCSFFVLIIDILSPSNTNNYTKNSQLVSSSNTNRVRNTKKNGLLYVDCSGKYRYYGENFVDHKGNFCHWGTGFYDYDDKYIHWGEKYKDSTGHYRQWGDGFVDAAGNYIDVKNSL